MDDVFRYFIILLFICVGAYIIGWRQDFVTQIRNLPSLLHSSTASSDSSSGQNPAAVDNPTEPQYPTQLTTLNGRTFKNVKVTQADADGIVITHDGGTAQVPFRSMSPETRKAFGQFSGTAVAAPPVRPTAAPSPAGFDKLPRVLPLQEIQRRNVRQQRLIELKTQTRELTIEIDKLDDNHRISTGINARNAKNQLIVSRKKREDVNAEIAKIETEIENETREAAAPAR